MRFKSISIFMYVMVFFLTGSLFGFNTILNDAGQNDATRLNTQRKIVKDSLNNIHVVWQTAGYNNVWYARSTDNGQNWVDFHLLSSNQANQPSIAIDPDGHLHVVWGEGPSGSGKIYYSQFSNDWSGAEPIIDIPGDSMNAHIAADSIGNLYVVCRNNYAGSDEIYFTKYDGIAWTTPKNISNTQSYSNYPSTVIDSFNRVHVIWNEDMGGSKYGIYHTFSPDGGVNFSAPVQIISQFLSTWRPSMAADYIGNVHVVYGENEDSEIRYVKFNGVEWSAPLNISRTQGASGSPSIGVDPNNNLFVTWWETGANDEIYWCKYSTFSQTWELPQNISLSTGRSAYPHAPEKISVGSLDFVWTEDYSVVYDRIVYNHPPAADAGEDKIYYIQRPCESDVTLDGAGSSDPDNDPLTYKWEGPFGVITGVEPVVPLGVGVYSIKLTVNDGNVDSEPDTVTITVLNQKPVANAGDDRTVKCRDNFIAHVKLDGSKSFSPTNLPLIYNWTGPFGVANGPNPDVSLPLGTHAITLIVSDGCDVSDPDTVIITVKNKPNTHAYDDFTYFNWSFRILGNTKDSWIYGGNGFLAMKSIVVDGADAVCHAYSNACFTPLSGSWKLSARMKANSQGASPDGPWGLIFGFIDTNRQNYVYCEPGNGDGTQLSLITSKGDNRLLGSFDATQWHVYQFEFSQGSLTFKVDNETYDVIDLHSKGFPDSEYQIWMQSIGRGSGSNIENIVTIDWVKLESATSAFFDDFTNTVWNFQILGNTSDSRIYGDNDSLVMKSVVMDGTDAVCNAYSNAQFTPLYGSWKLSARMKANSQGVSPDGPWGLLFGFIDASRQNYVYCEPGNGDGSQLSLITSKGDNHLLGAFDATEWHVYQFNFSQGFLTFKVDDAVYDTIDLNSKEFPASEYQIWLSSIGRGRGSSIDNIVTVDWVKLEKSDSSSHDIALIDLFHGRDGSPIAQRYGFSPKINSIALSSEVLEGVKVYFLFLPNTATAPFQASELDILQNYVASGGHILVVGGEDFVTPERANPLINIYGMTLGADTLSTETMDMFISHPITKDLSTISYIGADPITVDAPAQSLGYFRNGSYTGLAIHELNEQGKVVVFADDPAGGDADILWRNTWNFFNDRFILLQAPNGGENLEMGKGYTISWRYPGIHDFCRIDLYKDNTWVGCIARNVSLSDGAYEWLVGTLENGTFNSPGSGFTIQIRTNNDQWIDSSDNSFSISAASFLSLTEPGGGESWVIGSTKKITWLSSGVNGNCRLELYKDGIEVGDITHNLLVSKKFFTWVVGNYEGGSAGSGAGYTIKIVTDDDLYSDTSNIFSMTLKPFIAITAPNGGESWQLGSAQTISWNSSQIGGMCNLELYKNGVKVGFIAQNLPVNAGMFDWIVGQYDSGTAVIGNDYTVRIITIDTAREVYYDISNSTFTIFE